MGHEQVTERNELQERAVATCSETEIVCQGLDADAPLKIPHERPGGIFGIWIPITKRDVDVGVVQRFCVDILSYPPKFGH
ncbi:hypothetical protein CDZ97_28155 [Mameliella alba]|nr:hypothetical protein CDZ97_28155 [Mameliella alba]